MTITIPAGTTLYCAAGVPMYVADDSTADVVDVTAFGTYEVKFEDGEEYVVHGADLLPPFPRAFYMNPGNNVTHVNGADVTGHGARRRIS